jgi:hypothetical protein
MLSPTYHNLNEANYLTLNVIRSLHKISAPFLRKRSNHVSHIKEIHMNILVFWDIMSYCVVHNYIESHPKIFDIFQHHCDNPKSHTIIYIPPLTKAAKQRYVLIIILCIQQMHTLYYVEHFTGLPTCFDPEGSSSGHLIHWTSLCCYTRWFKYDRDKLWLVYTQIVPVIFEPPCIYYTYKTLYV